ncbi:hypothetical protein RKD35_004328 [Streptomyces albogriseolus]
MVRAAARRRAVRLALVAGAVFLFGVLCGEQARAADGPPFAGGVVRGDVGGVPSVSVLDGPTAAGDGPAARKPMGNASRLADVRGSRSDAWSGGQPAAGAGAWLVEGRLVALSERQLAHSGAGSAVTSGGVPGGERAASGQGARPRAGSGARSGQKPGLLSLGEAVRGADERVVQPAVARVTRPAGERTVHPGVERVGRSGGDHAPRPDGETPSESVVGRVLTPVGEAVGVPVAERIVRPVGSVGSVGSVVQRVLRPVGEVVGGVTEELDAVVGALPAVSVPAVSLPVLGQPAVLPPQSLPGLPALPGLPGLPGLPAHPLPSHLVPGPAASGGQAPEPPSAAADNPVPPAPVVHGPWTPVAAGAGAGASAEVVTPAAHRAVPASQAVPAPAGGAGGDGALGSRSSADQGGARHADAGAVPAAHRPVPRLVPGATASAETSGTREHSRDVHVPPA